MNVMRRSLFSILVLSVAAVICVASLSVASQGELTASDRDALINIRTSANTDGEIIETRPVGDRVEVLSLTKSNEGLIWYKVKVPQTGTTGWVRGDLVKIFGGKKPNHTATNKTPHKENPTASFPLPKPSTKPKSVVSKPPVKTSTQNPTPVASAPAPKPSSSPSPIAKTAAAAPSSSPTPTSTPSAAPPSQPNPAASPTPTSSDPAHSPAPTTSPTATNAGSGTPPSAPGDIATSTIVAFQTPSYAVRIFSRSGQLRLNLFNRKTNSVALKEVPIQSKTLEEGTTYSYSKDLEVTVFIPNTGATRLTTSALGSTVEEYAEPTATGASNP